MTVLPQGSPPAPAGTAARSWRRPAALVALAGLSAPAVHLVVLGLRLMRADPGFLFAVMPFIVCGLLLAGLMLLSVVLTTALGLVSGQSSRLPGVALGLFAIVGGSMLWSVGGRVAAEGALVSASGLLLVGALASPGAHRELGPLVRLPALRSYLRPGQQPWWELWRGGIAAGLSAVEWSAVGLLATAYVGAHVLFFTGRPGAALLCFALAVALALAVESGIRSRRR